ncbi:long-chain fatty acid--CoA ligase [Alteriqipengyuania sp. WL0013]|uniref:long-chain-fatty-acid--CoA ligase n=1 Tax=Alteriqipengyuania sp. WL0013 TaxID=3110773 RepID=UPI002CE1AF48|nr:long-chain fatty acid--CoA ligase [Alteriqipengyuania sp. WL0013]MEB3416297.1 long-chain fatty acid--CoA ligase [Alteriqipengyuania sp. WL0013]
MTVNKAAPEHPAASDYQHPGSWDLDLPPLTMPEMFLGSAARRGDAPLADFMGRRFSYADIAREARRFAAGLAERGIGKGDRIGLFLPNVPIYIAAYYGTMIAGAIAVNFSPLYTVEELSDQVEDSGITLLVTIDSAAVLPTALKVLDASSLKGLVVGRLADALPTVKSLALRLLGRKQLTAIPDRADVHHWADFLGAQEAEPVALDAQTDLALLQYTGGTTGRPKGAMLSHQNLTANARQVNAIDPFDPEDPDVILGVLPFFHVFANTCVLNRTVLKGGMIAMLPRFDAKQALKTLERVGATSFPGVPTMYQALLDHPQFAKTDFTSLRICISGGAPMPAPVQEKFGAATGARLVEGYGLTESSGVVSTNPYEGENRSGTIGQPLPATRVKLLDKENAELDAPVGEPGELVIAGPQVMCGYWNRPDADETAFARRGNDTWLRTGDVAVIDAQGYLQIVDRIKDMISVGGFKVFPSHIEDVLLEHQAVKEVLALGIPDDYLGEVPAAYVTLQHGDDAEISAEGLREWTNGRVGKHERLKLVEIRASLPKTMIGKLDRKALRAEVLG